MKKIGLIIGVWKHKDMNINYVQEEEND